MPSLSTNQLSVILPFIDKKSKSRRTGRGQRVPIPQIRLATVTSGGCYWLFMITMFRVRHHLCYFPVLWKATWCEKIVKYLSNYMPDTRQDIFDNINNDFVITRGFIVGHSGDDFPCVNWEALKGEPRPCVILCQWTEGRFLRRQGAKR